MTTKQVARSLECTRNRGRVSGPGPSKQTRLRALVSDACPRTTSAGCGSKHPEILRACSLRAREQPQNREGPGPGEREAEEHLRCELSCQGRRTPVDSGSHSQWSRSVAEPDASTSAGHAPTTPLGCDPRSSEGRTPSRSGTLVSGWRIFASRQGPDGGRSRGDISNETEEKG